MSNIVKIYRKKKGLSQKQLASKAGLKQSYISKIETNKKIPSIETLTSIAFILEVCPMILLNPLICNKCSNTLCDSRVYT